MSLKPISEQVVVIVGASSGIGREAALRFALEGARVVAAARGEKGLVSLVEEIRARGGEAHHLACDASDPAEMKRLADFAAGEYGRIDTWVHAAAVSIYATFEQTTPEEFRRVIEVNLLGQVYGAMAALPHLKREGRGALIHISSVEARRALPYQSAYAASKHGMKGFIEAMRMELKRGGSQVSVTEIMPSSINTPFFNKARTKLGVKPQGVPPIYKPEHVADAILYAAETSVAEITVGGAGAALAAAGYVSPRLADIALSLTAFEGQRTDEPKSEDAPDNLYESLDNDDRVNGDFSAQARHKSIYTWLETHPAAKRAIAVGAAGAVVLLFASRGKGRHATADKRKRRHDERLLMPAGQRT